MKDYLKRETIENYTAWDIKCKYVNNDKKLERKFKRQARRKNNEKMKKGIDNFEEW